MFTDNCIGRLWNVSFIMESTYMFLRRTYVISDGNWDSLINSLISSGYVSCSTRITDNGFAIILLENKAKHQPEYTTIKIFLIKSMKLTK